MKYFEVHNILIYTKKKKKNSKYVNKLGDQIKTRFSLITFDIYGCMGPITFDRSLKWFLIRVNIIIAIKI